MSTDPCSETLPYVIDRPTHSILIVRMISKPYQGRQIPDATFTFRIGEPQFDVWEQRYFEQQRLLQLDAVN